MTESVITTPTSRETEDVAPDTVDTHIGVITGTGHPDNRDKPYPSDVYLAPDSRFDYPIWQAVGTIGDRNGRGKIWLNTSFATADNYNIQTILHERGHNLGFHHDEDKPGIMSQVEPFPDLETKRLHPPTRITAQHTEGFEVWDFQTVTNTQIRGLVKDYITNRVPISRDDLQWATKNYIRRSNRETVLADGSIAEMLRNPVKKHTGYDFVGAGFYRTKNTGPYDPWGWGWDPNKPLIE